MYSLANLDIDIAILHCGCDTTQHVHSKRGGGKDKNDSGGLLTSLAKVATCAGVPNQGFLLLKIENSVK